MLLAAAGAQDTNLRFRKFAGTISALAVAAPPPTTPAVTARRHATFALAPNIPTAAIATGPSTAAPAVGGHQRAQSLALQRSLRRKASRNLAGKSIVVLLVDNASSRRAFEVWFDGQQNRSYRPFQRSILNLKPETSSARARGQ